jgi:hypothetical protein
MKTGADGAFRFDGVPVGAYGFAILPAGGGKWVASMRDFCKDMQEGAMCQTGPLEINP